MQPIVTNAADSERSSVSISPAITLKRSQRFKNPSQSQFQITLSPTPSGIPRREKSLLKHPGSAPLHHKKLAVKLPIPPPNPLTDESKSP
jgi:hypothetical protein